MFVPVCGEMNGHLGERAGGCHSSPIASPIAYHRAGAIRVARDHRGRPASSGALLGFFANPLVFIVLRSEEWRARLTRFYPYRWWFGLSLVVCAVAMVVYGVKYG
jgi:hypothetical protein